MIEQALTYVVYFGIILLSGIFFIYIADRLNFPKEILLILAGILIASIFSRRYSGINYSNFLNILFFIISSIILADSASQLTIKSFNTITLRAYKLTIINFSLNLIIFVLIASYILNIGIYPSIILAIALSGTVSFVHLKIPKSRYSYLLYEESLVNTPILSILGIILLTENITSINYLTVSDLFIKLVIGAATGIFVAILFFRILNKYKNSSSILSAVAAVVSYIISQAIGGIGLIAPFIFGLAYGNMFSKNLKNHSISEVSFFSEAVLYIVIGLNILRFPSSEELLFAFGLFILLAILRFIASESLNKYYSLKERIAITFMLTKGITPMIILIALTISIAVGNYAIGTQLLLVSLYSIILSGILKKLKIFENEN